MNSFKPGDRVRYVAGPPYRIGTVCTIVGPLRLANPCSESRAFMAPGDLVHEVDLVSYHLGARVACAKPEWLRHYREGDEPADHVEEWISDLLKPKRVIERAE